MDKTFKAITIKTDAKEKKVALRVGDSYNHEVEISLCQLGMVIDLLIEAKEELKPTEFKALGDVVEEGKRLKDLELEVDPALEAETKIS